MNRWITRVVSVASATSLMAIASASVAFADEGAEAREAPHHGAGHSHRRGLVAQALRLESLSPDQRAAIEQLASAERAATLPLRQADAVVLTQLAQEVERGAIDRGALSGAAGRASAAAAAQAAIRSADAKLHDALTAEQRAELVTQIEAHAAALRGHAGEGGPHPLAGLARRLGLSPQQEEQVRAALASERSASSASGAELPKGERALAWRAWLETFRGDAFDAGAAPTREMAGVGGPGARFEAVLEAAVPVLTPVQRATLARVLRERAAHESRA